MKKEIILSLFTGIIVSNSGFGMEWNEESSWDQTPEEAYRAYVDHYPPLKEDVAQRNRKTVTTAILIQPVQQAPQKSFWLRVFSLGDSQKAESQLQPLSESPTETIEETKFIFNTKEKDQGRYSQSEFYEMNTQYQKMILQDFTCEGKITFGKDFYTERIGLGMTDLMKQTSKVLERHIVPTCYENSQLRGCHYWEYILIANKCKPLKLLQKQLMKKEKLPTDKFDLYLSSLSCNQHFQLSFNNMSGTWFISNMPEGWDIFDFSQSPQLRIWLNMPWVTDNDARHALLRVLISWSRQRGFPFPPDMLKLIFKEVTRPHSPQELGLVK